MKPDATAHRPNCLIGAMARSTPVRRVVFTVALLLAASSCSDGREDLPIGTIAVEGNRIATHGNCNSGRRLDARETAEAIELTESVEAEDGGDCGDCLVVALSTDVGDREIIDTTTDEPIARDGDLSLHECFDLVAP